MKINLDKNLYDLKFYTEAVHELYPEIMFIIEDYVLITNDSTFAPQIEKIMEKAKQIKDDIDLNSYKKLRKAEYDKLNQFDLQYNDFLNGTNTWQTAIYNIKQKYPKPKE